MLKRTSSVARTKNGLPLKAKWRRDWQMVLLMIPGVVFLLVFFYLPVLGNVVAFQDFQPYLGIMHSEWNGLQNFVNLYANPDFWDALRNTLLLAAVQLLLFFPVPIGAGADRRLAGQQPFSALVPDDRVPAALPVLGAGRDAVPAVARRGGVHQQPAPAGRAWTRSRS